MARQHATPVYVPAIGGAITLAQLAHGWGRILVDYAHAPA